MLFSKHGIQKNHPIFKQKSVSPPAELFEESKKKKWSFSYLIRELKKKRSTFLGHFEEIASYLDCNKLGMVS